MYYHRSVYTLLIVVFTHVIDDITRPVANAGPAKAAALAEETAPVPPKGLMEWNGRDIIWLDIQVREREVENFWKRFLRTLSLSSCIVF